MPSYPQPPPHAASQRSGFECSWLETSKTESLPGYLLGSSCILVAQTGNTYIGVRTEPPRPLLWRAVTLIPVGSMENVSLCRWYRGPIQKKNEILTYQTSPVRRIHYSQAHTGREQIQVDCSLSITNLTFRDSGFYVILKKRTAPNAYEKGEVLLQVKESSIKDVVQAKNITLIGKQTAGIVVGALLGFIAIVGLVSHRKLNSPPRHPIETYTL